MSRSLVTRFFYALRDWRYGLVFKVLRRYCSGHVVDIGGWDFFKAAVRKGVPFERWTVLEKDPNHLLDVTDSRLTLETGDGCDTAFAEGSFDTVVCLQVAEHVFEPIRLMTEAIRIVKPGGFGVFMVPQTANLHGAPGHYQNFTRFWALACVERLNVELIEMHHLGGAWSTIASRLLYHFFQMFGMKALSYPEARRNLFFYAFFPLALVVITIGFPVCLLLSLGDMEEEANNHLFVLKKLS